MNLEKPSDVLSCDPPPHVSMSSVWNRLVSCPPLLPDSRLGSAVPDSHPELLLLWLLSPARLTSRGVRVWGAVDRKQFAITGRFPQQPWDTSACVENSQNWLTFLWVNPENWLSNANNQTRWIFLRRLKLFHFCGDLRRKIASMETFCGLFSPLNWKKLHDNTDRLRQKIKKGKSTSADVFVSSSFIHNQLIVFCHH